MISLPNPSIKLNRIQLPVSSLESLPFIMSLKFQMKFEIFQLSFKPCSSRFAALLHVWIRFLHFHVLCKKGFQLIYSPALKPFFLTSEMHLHSPKDIRLQNKCKIFIVGQLVLLNIFFHFIFITELVF